MFLISREPIEKVLSHHKFWFVDVFVTRWRLSRLLQRRVTQLDVSGKNVTHVPRDDDLGQVLVGHQVAEAIGDVDQSVVLLKKNNDGKCYNFFITLNSMYFVMVLRSVLSILFS